MVKQYEIKKTCYDFGSKDGYCVGDTIIGHRFDNRGLALLSARLLAEDEADSLNDACENLDPDESFGVCEDETRLKAGYVDVKYYTDKVCELVTSFCVVQCA